MSYTLESLSAALGNILGPEVASLVEKINIRPGDSGSPFLHLPDGNEHLGKESVARMVAKASNEYGVACRLAGLARAQYKIAYAAHKHKFRISLGPGKNAGEREGVAAKASVKEYEAMILLEAIVELCQSIESSTRIASESARRMLLGADQEAKADSRVETFSDALHDSDYTPF